MIDAMIGSKHENRNQDDLRSLAASVTRLSKLLTRDREGLPVAYLKDPDLRSAYVSYFLPTNMKKIHLALTDLSLHPDWLLSKESFRILDLGAGPGTALLGLLAFFGQQARKSALSCVAVDRVAENLRIAEDLFASYCTNRGINATLKTIRADIESVDQITGGAFDLIIFSNVLNELFPFDEDRIARRTGLTKMILDRNLAPNGSCIIIEPALRETSREMLDVRDGLLGEGFRIFSPCLTGARCPACRNPRDWCHEDIPWEPPALIKQIDRLTGLRKDALKFSYVVVRKDARSLSDIFGTGSFRVVSEPLITKGKIEFFICGRGARKLITRLDKDRTARNIHFEKLMRGAIVSFEGLYDEGTRFKVGQSTGVIIHKHIQ